ncbi:hypothetical protein [Candidatus Mycoplasma haematohominis]
MTTLQKKVAAGTCLTTVTIVGGGRLPLLKQNTCIKLQRFRKA